MPDKLSGYDQNKSGIEPDINETPDDADFGGSADSGPNLGLPDVPTTSRYRIREAIRSVYGPRQTPPTPETEVKAEQPAPVYEPDPEEVARMAAALIRRQSNEMVKEAKEFARQGQKEHALQLLSQAVRIDPDNSLAWTWLGGLLIDRNPERARYCLERAVKLDPDNTRAVKGLEGLKALLDPPTRDENEPIPLEMSLVRVEPETLDIAEVPPDPSSIKIGLSEVLENWREISPEVHPDDLPLGGAMFYTKTGKKKRFRRKVQGLALSLLMLGFLLILTVFGLWFLIAQPSFEPEPTPTPAPTAPPPTPTPSDQDVYAVRLRTQLQHYNGYLVRAKDLYRQFDSGKLRWDDLRKGYRELQNQIKEEKKQVDGLAGPTSNSLLSVYKNLQEVALVAINAASFMVSGTDNVSDEDLNEGMRQFNRLSALLEETVRLLDQVSPSLTTSPLTTLPNSTPTLSNTPQISPTPTPTTVPRTPTP